MQLFEFFSFFLIFVITVYVVGSHLNCIDKSFELHRQVDAIQMVTHNIWLYKEADKKYTDYNLKI